jgi:hypothetical protein
MARSSVTLQGRFHTINADCFKCSCCLAQVDRLNPSGTNPGDKVMPYAIILLNIFLDVA